MTVGEQAFAQAALLAGELEGQQRDLLKVLAEASASSLVARMKESVLLEDCRTELVTAAGMLALAQLQTAEAGGQVEEFKAGDLTVKRGRKTGSSQCLEQQARQLVAPYLKDWFCFQGV